MAVNAQSQRAKIEKLMESMAKEQAKLWLAESAEQRKKTRAEA